MQFGLAFSRAHDCVFGITRTLWTLFIARIAPGAEAIVGAGKVALVGKCQAVPPREFNGAKRQWVLINQSN